MKREKVDKSIKEIEDKREEIAYAIAMGYANGDEEIARKYYERFSDKLVNNTRVFIFDVENFNSTYVKEVNNLVKELGNFLVDPYFHENYLNNFRLAKPPSKVAKLKSISLYSEVTECEKLYAQKEELYTKHLIPYSVFFRLYNSGGVEKINQLNYLIRRLDKKESMYDFKNYISNFCDSLKLSTMNKKFSKLIETYKLNGFDDLLTLNTELDSFMLDEKSLGLKERKIIEESRENFRRRIGAKEDYLIDKKEITKIKKDIEQVYNYNFYKNLFENSNLKEFFDKNGYGYNLNNLKETFGLFFGVMGSTGIHSLRNLNNNYMNFCVFGSGFLDHPKSSQNDVIVHEFIHAVDKLSNKRNDFSIKYREINEAMTEYIAKKSVNYLKGNVLSKGNKQDLGFYSIYDSMMPLVKILENSSLWDDFVDAKLNNDTKGLEKKIGLSNLTYISRCFIEVSCSGSGTSKEEQWTNELNKTLDKIERKKSK